MRQACSLLFFANFGASAFIFAESDIRAPKSCICTETEISFYLPVFICGGGDLLHLGVTHRLALPGLAQLAIGVPGKYTDAPGLANGARGGHFYLNM
jgi:hypothetical protein